ncbi:CatB-related O-acetyltransferase [Macrococcoides canis]|uniref:CatB-related O-acetyltransferase n=1 Tax=Macrococcoides canis TaxID=1855823 RepID=UPI0022B92CD1|nr:CatB-related O-acetyltransferase [Macrococcus canis]
MATIYNGITFSQDNLIINASHNNARLLYDDAYHKFLNDKRIYTLPRDNASRSRLPHNTMIQVYKHAQIEPYSMFLVGRFFYSMGAFSSTLSELPVNTVVGRYTSIASNVKRMHGNHPTDRFTTSMFTYDSNATAFTQYEKDYEATFEREPYSPLLNPVVIGNNVWIGQDVLFSNKGITVGDGAIIAAGSIVTKDVPPYAIVGGNPAKVIKYRYDDKTIEHLTKLKWWQFAYGDFKGIHATDDIDTFIYQLEALIAKNAIHPFKPDVTTCEDFEAVTSNSV